VEINMAWNEPGNSNNDQDPWGRDKKHSGPPDLEDIFKKFFGGGKKGGSSDHTGNKGFIFTGIIVLAVIWALSGFYTVDEKQDGIVLQFGQYNRTVGAGWGWVPRGIEKVIKVDVNQLHQKRVADIMLTKDTNMIHVELGIQYRIIDARTYLFNLTSPDEVVRQAGEAALRKVIGDSLVDDVLTNKKEVIRSQTESELIKILADYDMGISISTVTLEDASPPKAVTDSFNEVNRAREDADRKVQEANSYHNREVPLAEAIREQRINQALGYKAQVIAKARGEIARFEQLLPQYRVAKEVTRQRLYIETVEEVMSNSSKVMVDVDGSSNMLYVPLQEIMNKHKLNKGAEQNVK